MKFIKWFLQFFRSTSAPAPRGVKFVEGTEWLCPRCHTTLAIARHDIYNRVLMSSLDWEVKDSGFWTFEHCDAHIMRYGADGHIVIMTPTGWVG